MKKTKYQTNLIESIESIRNNSDFKIFNKKIYYRFFSKLISTSFILFFFIIHFSLLYYNTVYKFMNIPEVVVSLPLTIFLGLTFATILNSYTVIDCDNGLITDQYFLFDELIFEKVLINRKDIIFVSNNCKYVQRKHSSYYYYTLSFLKNNGKIINLLPFYDYKVTQDLVYIISNYWQKAMFIVQPEYEIISVPISNDSFTLKSVEIDKCPLWRTILALVIVFCIFISLILL